MQKKDVNKQNKHLHRDNIIILADLSSFACNNFKVFLDKINIILFKKYDDCINCKYYGKCNKDYMCFIPIHH